MNPQDNSNMTASDAGKTKMIQDGHPTRFKVSIVKQLAAHNQHPGDLPPVPKDMERIFTTRGVNDGLQSYSEYQILDVEPAFAKEMCETTFKGSYTHTGEQLEDNAKKHEVTRAVYIEEFMAQFAPKTGRVGRK